MSLYLITGSAGTGKSTLCNALRTSGYEAYDVDIDGYARWQNNETNYVHPKSTIKKEDRTPSFLETHSWVVPRADIEHIRNNAEGHPTFICGVLDNEGEVRDLFDGIYALYTDDDTLRHRLVNRNGRNNDWGKQPHELQHTLKRHHSIYDEYRELGAVVIDATKPVERIVDEILISAI